MKILSENAMMRMTIRAADMTFPVGE
jgi:hypothetical protein